LAISEEAWLARGLPMTVVRSMARKNIALRMVVSMLAVF